MPNCHFSEDHFEQNLVGELRDRFGACLPHFKPSRVLENDLGFDFAVATDYFRHRRRGVHLDDPRIAGLIPVHQNAFLAGSFATSFIQCKTSALVTRPRQPLEYHYNFWRQPFYRFRITNDQNAKLVQIEQSLRHDAIVRYAAPCFHTSSDSDLFTYTGQIAGRSHFVSPTRLAGHTYYTYRLPNQRGRAFSEPEDIMPQPLIASVQEALSRNRREQLMDVVSKIWNAISETSISADSQAGDAYYISMANRFLGPQSDLPLDPFGIRQELPRMWPGKPENPTLSSFVAAVIGIENFSRNSLGSAVRIFHNG